MGRHIANLPLTPTQIRLGADVLYAGRYWRIVSVGDGRLSVQPVRNSPSPIRPSYGRVTGPVISWLVADRVREILLGKMDVSRGLDRASVQHLSAVLARVPTGVPDNCVMEWKRCRGDKVDYYYYTFAGGFECHLESLAISSRVRLQTHERLRRA